MLTQVYAGMLWTWGRSVTYGTLKYSCRLEHPTLWPGVHNGLIAALQLSLAPQLRPRYYVAIEERVYITEPEQKVLVGRSGLAVVGQPEAGTALKLAPLRPRC
jgi:hypothetical protein